MRTIRILYLVPDLIGPPSGIARYCRMVCLALGVPGVELQIVSLLDQPAAQAEAQRLFPGASYSPCAGSRGRLIALGLASIARSRPDLILIGHANFSGLGWALSRLARAPFAVWMYGTDVWHLLPPARRRGLRRADLCFSISRFTARRAGRKNGVARSKTRILFNCLDPAFEPQPASKYLQEHLNAEASLSMLTVSRISLFEPFKGHEYVIQAMPALLARFPGLIYHVVGDGDRRPLLEDLARELGVEGVVRFHGAVSDLELARLYGESSLFIMPSLVEGFGFVFLEAMSQGTPAIGGDRDASPEVIVHGETGLLVNPTSAESIVEAASRILSDPNLRQAMSQAAIARARAQFSFAQFQSTLIAHLGELCPDIPKLKGAGANTEPQVLEVSQSASTPADGGQP